MVFSFGYRGCMRARPGATAAALACSAVLATTGCSALDSADDGAPHVTAALYPYAFVADRVAGRYADVTNLTTPGVEPHDMELTPRQVAEISEADLVIFQAGVQPSVDEAVDQNASGTALDVTDLLDADPSGAEHARESAVTGDSLHEHTTADPHLWLDPTELIPVTRSVADELADLDASHAADYRANAGALVRDLRALDADFRSGLAECERTEFVTSHAAFGHLAARYGLTMVPIAGLSPDAEPSPQRLADIADSIRRTGVTTVFSERLGSKQYAETLAEELGVRAAVLDPVEGLTEENADENYLTLMRQNLQALRAANGCR